MSAKILREHISNHCLCTINTCQQTSHLHVTNSLPLLSAWNLEFNNLKKKTESPSPPNRLRGGGGCCQCLHSGIPPPYQNQQLYVPVTVQQPSFPNQYQPVLTYSSSPACCKGPTICVTLQPPTASPTERSKERKKQHVGRISQLSDMERQANNFLEKVDEFENLVKRLVTNNKKPAVQPLLENISTLKDKVQECELSCQNVKEQLRTASEEDEALLERIKKALEDSISEFTNALKIEENNAAALNEIAPEDANVVNRRQVNASVGPSVPDLSSAQRSIRSTEAADEALFPHLEVFTPNKEDLEKANSYLNMESLEFPPLVSDSAYQQYATPQNQRADNLNQRYRDLQAEYRRAKEIEHDLKGKELKQSEHVEQLERSYQQHRRNIKQKSENLNVSVLRVQPLVRVPSSNQAHKSTESAAVPNVASLNGSQQQSASPANRTPRTPNISSSLNRSQQNEANRSSVAPETPDRAVANSMHQPPSYIHQSSIASSPEASVNHLEAVAANEESPNSYLNTPSLDFPPLISDDLYQQLQTPQKQAVDTEKEKYSDLQAEYRRVKEIEKKLKNESKIVGAEERENLERSYKQHKSNVKQKAEDINVSIFRAQPLAKVPASPQQPHISTESAAVSNVASLNGSQQQSASPANRTPRTPNTSSSLNRSQQNEANRSSVAPGTPDRAVATSLDQSRQQNSSRNQNLSSIRDSSSPKHISSRARDIVPSPEASVNHLEAVAANEESSDSYLNTPSFEDSSNYRTANDNSNLTFPSYHTPPQDPSMIHAVGSPAGTPNRAAATSLDQSRQQNSSRNQNLCSIRDPISPKHISSGARESSIVPSPEASVNHLEAVAANEESSDSYSNMPSFDFPPLVSDDLYQQLQTPQKQAADREREKYSDLQAEYRRAKEIERKLKSESKIVEAEERENLERSYRQHRNNIVQKAEGINVSFLRAEPLTDFSN